jgi:hypothetical protein
MGARLRAVRDGGGPARLRGAQPGHAHQRHHGARSRAADAGCAARSRRRWTGSWPAASRRTPTTGGRRRAT